MKVSELIALLQQLDPNAAVVVEDVHSPRRKEFLGDYGFLPQLVSCEHDDGPIVVLVGKTACDSPSIIHRDDRYHRYPRHCSG